MTKRAFFGLECLAMLLSTLDMSFFRIARRTAHGARRTAETFGQTAFDVFVAFRAFAVLALIVGGFCTL
ncbi:MAG: hypothetical protein ACR2P4_03095, partial [Gammaproteobacteria bacterium]